MNIIKNSLLTLGLSWILSGCTTLPATSDGIVNQLDGPLAQMQVDTKQLYQRMQRLTADKNCQETAECKLLPVGNKACGGPEQYLLYSSQQTDEKLLAITNDRYSKLKKQQQQRLGMYTTCQMVIEPVAQCRQRQCVILE